MKNADCPAMPLSGDAYQDFAGYVPDGKHSYNPECQGLTKREYFAGLAMQGLCNAADISGVWQHDSGIVAATAVEYADALLAELERTK